MNNDDSSTPALELPSSEEDLATEDTLGGALDGSLVEEIRTNFSDHFQLIQEVVEYDGTRTQVRYYMIRPGPNGEPNIEAALSWLTKLAIQFALDNRTFGGVNSLEDLGPDEVIELYREACKRLVKRETAGGLGEMLLWALIESSLGAPQAVAKLSHKDSLGLEAHGMDAIHASWDEEPEELTLIWGESKVKPGVRDALREAIQDLAERAKPGELHIDKTFLIRFPSQLYPGLEDALKKAFETPGDAPFSLRYEYAVFSGFNLQTYRQEQATSFQGTRRTFRGICEAECLEHAELSQDYLPFENQGTATIHVFLLPFVSVDDARAFFLRMITNT